MDTVITIFGRIPLFIFPLLVGIGVGVGLFWSVWPILIFPKNVRTRLDAGTTALAGALVGGRAGFVLMNWVYFREHLVEVPQVWLGGLSGSGGLSGALIVLFISARIKKLRFEELTDGLRPLFTSVVASAWLASWMTGHAYGAAVDAWWGIPARDEWGLIAQRWPTQLVGAICALGIHWGVDQLMVRKWIKTPGIATGLELAGLSLVILAFTPYRADPGQLWGAIRTETWASIGLFILSILMVFFSARKAETIGFKPPQAETHED